MRRLVSHPSSRSSASGWPVTAENTIIVFQSLHRIGVKTGGYFQSKCSLAEDMRGFYAAVSIGLYKHSRFCTGGICIRPCDKAMKPSLSMPVALITSTASTICDLPKIFIVRPSGYVLKRSEKVRRGARVNWLERCPWIDRCEQAVSVTH